MASSSSSPNASSSLLPTQPSETWRVLPPLLDRFTLSPQEYLVQSEVLTYLEDAVSLILMLNRTTQQVQQQQQPGPSSSSSQSSSQPLPASKSSRKTTSSVTQQQLQSSTSEGLDPNSSNSNKLNPVDFLSVYFKSVVKGENVFFRHFAHLQATARNRRAFLKLFARTQKSSILGEDKGQRSCRDIHEMLLLLCPDFPLSLVKETALILLSEFDPAFTMSIRDFLYAFQLTFCFGEWVQVCIHIYQSCMERSLHDTSRFVAELDSKFSSKMPYPKIPTDVLKAAIPLSLKKFSSHAELLLWLSRSDALSAFVGILPTYSANSPPDPTTVL